MTLVGEKRLESVEKRSSMAFLVGGMLMVFTAALYLLDMTTPMSFGRETAGLPLIVGILISYVALVGLASRLAVRTRRLARVGLGLLVAPFLANLFVILVYAPSVETVPPSVEILVAVLWGTIGIGSAVLGVGSLRTGTFRPAVGVALFGWAVLWFGIALAGFVYGAQHPVWIELVIDAVGGVSLLVIGYGLRAEPVRPDRTEPADAAA